jgi:hypothetical protein
MTQIPYVQYFYFIAGVTLVVVAILLIIYWYLKRPRFMSLDLRLLLVKVSKTEFGEEGPGREKMFNEINLSEQLFSALSALEQPFVLEMSVHHTGEEIHFYIAVPRSAIEFTKRQIQGLFPDSQVAETDDYNISGPNSSAAAAYLTLKDNFVLPIRTYRESEVDTFAPIVSTFSKLEEVGEGATLQMVVRSAARAKYAKSAITGAIGKLRKGEKLSDVIKTALITAKDVKKFLTEGGKKKDGGAPKPVDEEAVRILQAKINKPLFFVNARIVASAPTKDRAEDILMSIAGSFSQFAAPLRNQIKIVKPKDIKQTLYQSSFREYDADQSMVLNSEELASIFHIPTFSTDVPRIKWLKVHEAPPPQNLPQEGTIIGKSVFRGDERLVRMTDEDRRRHLYIIGQTGTGKSFWTLLPLIKQDMENGKGVCVIDPHGDLINNALTLVPKNRIDDVIVFDPGDMKRPLGLNMLEYNLENPQERSFIVNEMLGIFDRLYDLKATGGPMFEQYMRNALLLLMEDAVNEPATLMEVPRIFTDEAFRKRKLARIKNVSVIDFWEKEAAKTTGEQGLANMAPYITSKFGSFISNDFMRPIIGQTKSAFNFRKIMDEGKILFVNLSKGKIGEINSSLLGMIFTGRLLLAALSREDTPDKEKLKDLYLYIDEFQNYTTDSIGIILSEARKYKLCLILAHQFIAQLKDEIREAVFGNVGSMMVYRIGVPDTEFFIKTFAPEFDAKDLISVENFHAFVKLLIQGQPTRPFNIEAIKPTLGPAELREKLKELSRLTYGRDLAEIEEEIYRRLRG